MGIDYDSSAIVGFVVDSDELLRPFLVKREKTTHLEDRYDVKTGKKVAPDVVVDDPGGYDIVIAGERFEGPDSDFDPENDSFTQYACSEIPEFLEQKLGCKVSTHGDLAYGEYMSFSFEPSCLRHGPTGYSLSSVADALGSREFDRIKAAAKRIGIQLDEPSITTVTSMY